MLAGRGAARKQLRKLYQRQHLDYRIAWIEGTDVCSTEDDRSWGYYAVRIQYKTCKGITLQSLFFMREGERKSGQLQSTPGCLLTSTANFQHLFPPPHSPQRSTLNPH